MGWIPGISQIVGHAIDERGLGGEAVQALEEEELGPAVEDDPAGGDERRDAGGAAAMRRVWAIRPPGRKIDGLKPPSFVDLPAHLCPNWGPATRDDEQMTMNGRR